MSRTTLVLPPKFLDEIKDVPEHILSNAWATTDVCLHFILEQK
jgi:hypothetical protein